MTSGVLELGKWGGGWSRSCVGPPRFAEEGVFGSLEPEPLSRETMGVSGVALCRLCCGVGATYRMSH